MGKPNRRKRQSRSGSARRRIVSEPTTLYDLIVEDGHRLLDEATDRMLSASFASFPRPIDPDILARVDASHAAHTERASFRERVRDLAYDDETRLSVLDRADVLDGAAAELRREHERAKRGAK